MSAEYNAWVLLRAQQVERDMRALARQGHYDLAVWLVPGPWPVWGRLVVGTSAPPGASDILRLGPHGTNLLRCPYPDIKHHLWNACRSLPVLGEGQPT